MGARSPYAPRVEMQERRDEADRHVLEIAQLMLSQKYNNPTVRELAAKWEVAESTVRSHAATASRLIRLSVNVSEIAMRVSDSLESLSALGYECWNMGERREAIVAFSKVAEIGIHAAGIKELTGGNSSGAIGRAALIAAGWRPPASLPGLPQPPSKPLVNSEPAHGDAKAADHNNELDDGQHAGNAEPSKDASQ